MLALVIVVVCGQDDDDDDAESNEGAAATVAAAIVLRTRRRRCNSKDATKFMRSLVKVYTCMCVCVGVCPCVSKRHKWVESMRMRSGWRVSFVHAQKLENRFFGSLPLSFLLFFLYIVWRPFF